MTFWKMPLSKKFQLLFALKCLILINFSYAKLKYQYDACDSRWANDTLWLNYALRTNSTICQDQDIVFKKYPQGFVSLVATAYANKNYSCGEGRLCDPAVFNRVLIRCNSYINSAANYANKTLFQCVGLKPINHTLRIWELEDEVLTGYTLLAAHALPNHTEVNNRFLIEDTYEHYVRGVDYRGRSVMYPWAELQGIEKFKILNLHRELRKNKNKTKEVSGEQKQEENNNFNNNESNSNQVNDNNQQQRNTGNSFPVEEVGKENKNGQSDL